MTRTPDVHLPRPKRSPLACSNFSDHILRDIDRKAARRVIENLDVTQASLSKLFICHSSLLNLFAFRSTVFATMLLFLVAFLVLTSSPVLSLIAFSMS